MSQIIIAIVSHGHYDYISRNLDLVEIAKIDGVRVIIKDNLKDIRLESYSKRNNFEYLVTNKVMGFGENNNFIFDHAKKELSTMKDDWFIILNPDVVISVSAFSGLQQELNAGNGSFFAPNLFKDGDFKQSENSIRYFTKPLDLLNLFKIKSINRAYNKDALKDKAEIEWASGAFLCITVSKFESVNGFDTNYYMYYEDVDLCYRLKQRGTRLLFLKYVKAVHKGVYNNRSILSKHFLWYLSSLVKFLRVRY